jgi:hypothetical protein
MNDITPMKKIIIRIALFVIYSFAAFVNLAFLPGSYDLWSCGLAVTFAIATVFFTGRASFFVLFPVFAWSFVAPIAALSSLARSVEGSWEQSLSSMVSTILTYNPLHGFELVIPVMAASISLILMMRWMKRRGKLET